MADPSPLVGHAAEPLLVEPGTTLGGYAARTGPSTGTLDPLEVSAVVVSHHLRTAVLCVADVPSVNLDVVARTRQRVAAAVGTHPALVWLVATHTHAGPDTGLGPRGAATPEPWLGRLPEAAVLAAERAHESVAPADLTLHQGELAGVGGQRSGPRRSLTTPVSVIAVRRPGAAQVTGALLVTACHPTVLDAANRSVSADLNGATRRELGQLLPGAWVVAATGAAGDMSTRPHRRDQRPAEVDRLGRAAATQIVALLESPADARFEPTRRLTGEQTVVDLHPAPAVAPAEVTAALERARAAVERARQDGDPRALRDATVALQGAEHRSMVPRDRSPVGCAVAALDLAGIVLLGIGGEPYSALASRCAGAVLVGYANGYCGYLPTTDAFGRDDYEVLISPVAPGEGERAIDEARALLVGSGPA